MEHRRCQAEAGQRNQEDSAIEEGGDEDAEFDWSFYPEQVASIVVHHDSILRNKRVLLTYMCADIPCAAMRNTPSCAVPSHRSSNRTQNWRALQTHCAWLVSGL